MENHKQITKDWLLEHGMKDVGDGLLHSTRGALSIRFLDFSEELGQHLDFCWKSPSKRLVTVYSAYYLDRDDFLNDDVYKYAGWWRQRNGSQ